MLIHSLTYYPALKIQTTLLWDLALLFGLLSAFCLLFIFYSKNSRTKAKRGMANTRSELAPVISNFLFHSPEDPKAEQQEYVILKISIREYLHKKKHRHILSQILLDLQKDVAGVTRERLYKLYLELGLHHDALAKLKSWRWYTISQGIQELSQMKVPNGDMLIRKFINDKRGVVRKQAELAIVGAKPEGINYFLDTTTCSISEWQQLKLIEALGNIPDYIPPRFCNWLLSNNKDVVLFALRLIKHYNQKGAEAAITELVKHKNDPVKIAAIQCIVDFNFGESLDLLSKIYTLGKESVRIAILNAFMALGNEKNIPFLHKTAASEKNFLVHTKALAAINAIQPESVLPTSGLIEMNTTDQDANDPTTEEIPEHTAEPGSKPSETSSENNLEVERFEVVEPEELPSATSSESTLEVESLEVVEPEELLSTKSSENTLEVERFEVVEPEELSSQHPTVEKEFFFPFLPEFEVDFSQNTTHLSLADQLPGDESHFDTISKHDLEAAYAAMSEGEKQQLIEAFEDNTGGLSSKEHALVEFIAQEETNSELGYRAFSILRAQLRKEEATPHTAMVSDPYGNELPLYQHTIFYELYHHASDLDSRLLLLQEIAAIGDSKELPFLYELTKDPNPDIKTAVDKAITTVKKNLETTLTPETVRTEDQAGEILELKDHPEDNRLPLELAFLYDEVGILPATSQQAEAIFDFDLSEAFEIRSDIEKEYRGQ